MIFTQSCDRFFPNIWFSIVGYQSFFSILVVFFTQFKRDSGAFSCLTRVSSVFLGIWLYKLVFSQINKENTRLFNNSWGNYAPNLSNISTGVLGLVVTHFLIMRSRLNTNFVNNSMSALGLVATMGANFTSFSASWRKISTMYFVLRPLSLCEIIHQLRRGKCNGN